MDIRRSIIRATVLLALVALVSTLLVALTFEATRDEIAASEQAALRVQLAAVLPASAYDNAITEDTTTVLEPAVFGTCEPAVVYRARKNGIPTGAVMTVIAPDGYSGPIKLLVGVYADGTVAGVRVVSHKETPGLGDAIEAEKSSWIYSFDGTSLDDPPLDQWAVQKDGGAFDSFTGATITPRAVVAAVKRALLYFAANKAKLFAAPAAGEPIQPPPQPNERLQIPPQRGEADAD
jgi:electron transport complex protein RnfG